MGLITKEKIKIVFHWFMMNIDSIIAITIAILFMLAWNESAKLELLKK